MRVGSTAETVAIIGAGIGGLYLVAELGMTGRAFAPEARTLERLGLAGMDAPQIRRVVREGFS
ncbi:MAG: hypothetical protein WA709_02510 [Stellaceae bacterium]